MEKDHHSSSSRKLTHSVERPIVYAVRDFPPACGTPSHASRSTLPLKRPRESHVLVKNPSPDHVNPASSPKQEAESSNSPSDRAKGKGICVERERPGIRYTDTNVPTPCDKVLGVLSHFKQVFRQLSREKEARRGGDLFEATERIDIKTLDVLENVGMRVNTEKRIGSVPGINIGDEYQYKTELRLIGLHSKTMNGIDYMKIGDVKVATSIVASEGYGYEDKFVSGVVVYTGEGGNVISKEKKTEDQKLINGNLALVNSMRRKSPVRVIRGEERLDRKGKRYVYDGLYLVSEYWSETIRDNSGYKFKLCRIPGQPLLS